jgi:Leucine-rich repeat (LRR) protein
LGLNNNLLAGEVPAALGQLAALRGLGLHNNQLTGAVPAELGQLAALKVLSLGINQVASVPSALRQQLRDRGVHVGLDEGVAHLG